MRVLGLLVVVSLWLGAECSQDIKKEYIKVTSTKPLSLSKMERLYNQCKNSEIAMMYYLAKAETAISKEEPESAYKFYKKSLDTLNGLNPKIKGSPTSSVGI